MKKNNFYIIIPARKNSKRIPNKNLTKILNLRLIEYTIYHAKLTKNKTNIFISSDDSRIKKISEKYKIDFTPRSKKNSQQDIENNDSQDECIYSCLSVYGFHFHSHLCVEDGPIFPSFNFFISSFKISFSTFNFFFLFKIN